ncbi:MAG: hypothetical protein CSA62_08720 [Planctomycetota bacterium]|nr:MAG: hypothetical protein CSA62_08720 [Planctomycetota bacterium]
MPGLKGESSRDQVKPGLQERRLVRSTVETPLYLYENKDLAPKVAGPFAVGTLFVVLDEKAQHGFRRVGVLGGMQGYVYGRYLELTGDGYARTTGSGVSFRYRPKPETAETPVMMLPKGTRVRVLSPVDGRKLSESWVKVLSDHEVGAFVPTSLIEEAGKLLAVDPKAAKLPSLIDRIPDESLHAGAKAQIAAQEARWREAQERIAEERRQRALLNTWKQKQRSLFAEFRQLQKVVLKGAERKQGAEVKAYLPVLEDAKKRANELLTELDGIELATESQKTQAKKLLDSLNEIELRMEAVIALIEPVKPIESEPQPAALRTLSPKRRFALVGWLQYRPGSNGPSAYRLAKGGKTVAWLDVEGDRYDLLEFVGMEIGIRGEGMDLAGHGAQLFKISRMVVLTGKR